MLREAKMEASKLRAAAAAELEWEGAVLRRLRARRAPFIVSRSFLEREEVA